MRKKEVRVKTLKGLFVPDFWPEVKEIIKACELMTEASKAVDPDDMVDIEFDFEKSNKMVVYREFIHAVNKGWVKVRLCVVIFYLAKYSNLADSDSLENRINAIHQGFKRYKSNYS